jgi:hypothetical protein
MTTPALAQNVRGKGRHYQHPKTGELLPSVTNIIGVLNKPALPRWAAKMVAEQAVAMRDSLPNLEPDEAVDLLKGAPWRKSGRAADRGTTVHAYLEARLQGLEPKEISGEAARFRKAADAFLDEWEPEPVAIELTVFGPGYAGTGDLWCRARGANILLDYKTSKAIYNEAALQLAALAHATLDPDGNPIPATDEAWVIRIGEDGYEAKQVADLDYNYQAFIAALQLWHWVNGEKVYEPAA